MQMSEFTKLESGTIHYLKIGSGKRLLLCFHGYGNNASLFIPFQKYLANDFTILSIDLPHHGRSKWTDGHLLHRHELKQLVETLMALHHASQISLVGYSMGGRVCLVIAEMMPEKIERLLLVASDGLIFNPLYFFVTKTLIGRKIFRSFLADPNKYLKLLKWLRDKDWLDASRYKFITYYLENAEDRKFLRHVWQDMSLIVPSMKNLKSSINKYQIQICIFSGKFDRVIPTTQAQQFMKGLSTVQLLVVQHGHRMFGADSLPKMASYLINGKC